MPDVQQKLRELVLGKKRGKCDVKIAPIDSGGANYTSALFRITVITPDGEELRLFAKVASFGVTMREKINADWWYTTEQFVYTKLAHVYRELQIRHSVEPEHRFVFPKLFACSAVHGNETVVTEDLEASGYRSRDRFLTMNWEHAAISTEVLAKFHALSFAFEKEYAEEFQKIAVEMEYKSGSADDVSMRKFWEQMVEGSLQVIKEKNRDRVRKIVYDEGKLRSYNKPIEKVVLAHGDYRLSNLLFKRQNGKLKAIPVDYQLLHSGCPLGDLLYLVTLGTDRRFRGKHFQQLVEHYYEQLALALERLSLDIVDVYPREVFDMELKMKLPHMALIGVMTLPAVTVDVEAVPKMDNNSDVSNFLMKPNDLFADRFNGIVDDLIEWGAI